MFTWLKGEIHIKKQNNQTHFYKGYLTIRNQRKIWTNEHYVFKFFYNTENANVKAEELRMSVWTEYCLKIPKNHIVIATYVMKLKYFMIFDRYLSHANFVVFESECIHNVHFWTECCLKICWWSLISSKILWELEVFSQENNKKPAIIPRKVTYLVTKCSESQIRKGFFFLVVPHRSSQQIFECSHGSYFDLISAIEVWSPNWLDHQWVPWKIWFNNIINNLLFLKAQEKCICRIKCILYKL